MNRDQWKATLQQALESQSGGIDTLMVDEEAAVRASLELILDEALFRA